MGMNGLKVGIIGGSISGCASAVALHRAGYEVEIFERSSRGLMDRGSGIGVPGPLRTELMDKEYLPSDFTGCEMKPRWWQFPDGTPQGRRLWTQQTSAFANNWGNLWQALRENVPNGDYHEGKKLTNFFETQNGVTAQFDDGIERTFDLLVGADGYHSVVRNKMHPNAHLEYAGYVLWRGNYPESRLSDTNLIDAISQEYAWLTVPFPGGHGVLYMIPGFDGNNRHGQRRVNWAIYNRCPKTQQLDGVESIPPGAVTNSAFAELETLLSERFPPAIRDLILLSRREEVSIQPIYDSIVDTYVSKSTMLIGDAGTMTRPHTASGATKALEDALALEAIAKDTDNVSELLSRYDTLRCGQAKTISEIGRRIGQAQVIETPDWGNMTPADFESWHNAILAGDNLYLYGKTA